MEEREEDLIGAEPAATTPQKVEQLRVYAEWLMAGLEYQEIRSENGIRLFRAPPTVQERHKNN